jgi:hypothetical protein
MEDDIDGAGKNLLSLLLFFYGIERGEFRGLYGG